MFQLLVRIKLYSMYKKVIELIRYHFEMKSGEHVCTLTTSLKNNPFQFQYVLLQGHHLPNEHVVPSYNQSS